MMYEVSREIVALFGAPPKLLSRRGGRRAEKCDDFPTFATFASFVVKNASDG